MEEQGRERCITEIDRENSVVQVRSESSGLQQFTTLKEAFEKAKADDSIWNISFTLFTGERVRLIRQEDRNFGVVWIYASIVEEYEKWESFKKRD